METSEQQLAFVKAVDNCNLCITDRRLVVISPKSYWLAGAVGHAVGGTIGGFIGATLQKREDQKRMQKEETPKGLTIDELLAKDPKSYAVPYEELDWICLNKSRFGSNLTFRANKIGWKQLKLNKAQVEQLSCVLPSIVALSGKFKVN